MTTAHKLHNLQATIRNVRRHGLCTLSRFNASPKQMLWYFARISQVLNPYRATVPIDELDEAVPTLVGLLGPSVPEAFRGEEDFPAQGSWAGQYGSL